MIELPWVDLEIPGRGAWSYVFIPPFEHTGDECYGLMHPKRRKVYFDATRPVAKIRRTWAHETFHLLCHFGRGRRDPLHVEHASEEDYAEIFEVGGPLILAAFGFKCPPLPPGFAAFRRRCVGQHVEVE